MTLAIFLLMLGVVEVVKGWKGWTLNDIMTGERTPPDAPAGSSFDIASVIPDWGADLSANPSSGGTQSGSDLPASGPPMANAKASIMYQEADRIAGLHLKYLWGGGHRPPPPADGPFDCSGFVSRVLDKAGLLRGHVPLTSGLLMFYGEPGEGKSVTIWSNPAHTFLDFNGRHIGTGPAHGQGPSWHQHTTKGFTPRHPKGL